MSGMTLVLDLKKIKVNSVILFTKNKERCANDDSYES
jgi:hypothetical protein